MNDFGNLLHDYASGKRGAKCSHPISAVYTAEDGSEVCGACGTTLKASTPRTYTADELAAAVQAEREACMDIVCSFDPDGCHDIVNAIRARNGSQ